MRPLFAGLLLLSSSTLPLTARADTVDLFTLTGGGHVETWTLPAIDTFSLYGRIFSAPLIPLTETMDGIPIAPPLQSLDFFQNGSGLTMQGLFQSYFVTLLGPSVLNPISASGPFFGSSPFDPYFIYTVSFDLGTTSGTLVPAEPGAQTPYTLTIFQQETALTPEPSSLILLATGLLAAAPTLRRRWVARR